MYNPLMIKIAIKSLLRRKVRSLLVILMVGMSLWGVMLMQGIYDGMMEQMIQNAIRSDSGHISLYGKGYRLDPVLAHRIDSPKRIEEMLSSDPRIKSHVTRMNREGVIATARYSRSASILGIDLKAEKKHGRLDSYLIEGEYGFGKKERGALIGYKLAEKLKLKLGSKAVLSTQDINNDIASLRITVTGILRTNNLFFDQQTVLVDRHRVQERLLTPGTVTRISLLLHDPEQNLKAVQSELQKSFPELEVFRWDELYPALLQGQVMMQMFNFISYLLISLVSTIGIFGVVLVSVLERIREFGILLALGNRFRDVALMVFSEALILALLGFVLGVILGGGTLWYYQVHGLDLSMFSDALGEFGMDAVTYALVKPEYFVTAFLSVLSAAFLSVLFPLRVLKRSKPINVIRGE